MKNRVIITILSVVVIFLVAGLTIFLARGWQLNPQTMTVEKTGLLAISSIPDGGSVHLDNHLVSATNTTISYLQPKTYALKITKEGYTTWEKAIEIRKELVTKIEALLFPLAPELKPLTFTGISDPQISPDGQRIVWAIKQGEKAGLWSLDITDGRPIIASREARQVVKDTPILFFSQNHFFWAPNSRDILVTLQENGRTGDEFMRNFVLNTDQLNDKPQDITLSLAKQLISWQDEINLKANQRIQKLPTPLQKIASDSAALAKTSTVSAQAKNNSTSDTLNYNPDGLHWSPGETKFFYYKDTNLIVVDLKTTKQYTLPKTAQVAWYPETPDSNHLVVIEEGKVSIVEADGANKMNIFSGNFANNFVYPWGTGGRLVILTNFNGPADTLPNLYSIGLR